MDEYSKTGAKNYRAVATARENETIRLMREGLEIKNEQDFIHFLRDRLDIRSGDTRYLAAIKIWRTKHL